MRKKDLSGIDIHTSHPLVRKAKLLANFPIPSCSNSTFTCHSVFTIPRSNQNKGVDGWQEVDVQKAHILTPAIIVTSLESNIL